MSLTLLPFPLPLPTVFASPSTAIPFIPATAASAVTSAALSCTAFLSHDKLTTGIFLAFAIVILGFSTASAARSASGSASRSPRTR